VIVTKLPNAKLTRQIGRWTYLLAALGFVGLTSCRKAPPAPSATPVQAQTVELTNASETLTLTGEIRAQFESDLAFRVGGRIIERKVDVGDHVVADQVLAKIDPNEQQASVTAAEADVQSADAKLKDASSAFDRQKLLLSRGSAMRADYDRAEEVFRTAQGFLDAAKAQLGTARDALAQAVLRAENAGVVTVRSAEVGEVVQPAQRVFSVAHDGPRDAVFNVNESAFGDQPVDRTAAIQINLVSNPAVTTTGKVREIAPTAQGVGGTVAVKVRLEQSPPGMTLGAAVTGKAPLSSRKAAVLPATALLSDNGKPAVWVVDPQTRAVTLRPITVDRYETGKVVIAKGLQQGEIVVTSGTQFLRPNQTVAISTTAKP
jgi:RND family efflux transporter MFP subunit